MSTKIYNGFRYSGHGGLIGCYNQLHHISRPVIADMAAQQFINFIAQTSSEIIDRCMLGMEMPELITGNAKPIWIAFGAWRELDGLPEDRHLNLCNTEFSVHLFPMTRSTIIGIYNTSQDWGSWFINQDFITEYGYWNDSDRPDHIAPRQWRERERLWGEAFISSPCESSMDMKLSPTFSPIITAMADPLLSSKIINAIVPKEERARSWAKKTIMQRFYLVEGGWNGEDYFNSEKGIRDFEEERSNILKKLIDIDADSLGKQDRKS